MLPVTLLSPAWRLVTGVFVATSLVTLPTYLVATFVLPPVPPVVMIRSFLVGTALPGLVAWAILRAFRGTAEVAGEVLRLRRGDLEVDAPTAAIAVRSWWLPLPMAGLTLRRRGGGRLPVGMATADPVSLLDLLAPGVDVTSARRNPTAVAAHTRWPRGWRRVLVLVKFPGLGTIPAAALFYTHQHIAYGGTFGQYYLESPAAWLSTFAQYWATTVILLASYASMWRAAGELVVWCAAWAGDTWAARARTVVEAACALAYYVGVPAYLALRYLA